MERREETRGETGWLDSGDRHASWFRAKEFFPEGLSIPAACVGVRGRGVSHSHLSRLCRDTCWAIPSKMANIRKVRWAFLCKAGQQPRLAVPFASCKENPRQFPGENEYQFLGIPWKSPSAQSSQSLGRCYSVSVRFLSCGLRIGY